LIIYFEIEIEAGCSGKVGVAIGENGRVGCAGGATQQRASRISKTKV
jgi:hypothetical protein